MLFCKLLSSVLLTFGLLITTWKYCILPQFGCSLVECFLKTAQINVNLFNNGPEKMLPAFYHTYEFKMDKRYGVLKPHPIVCKLFKGYLAKQGEISMETTSVPMLVPPRPWRATKDGAYLILPGLKIFEIFLNIMILSIHSSKNAMLATLMTIPFKYIENILDK